MVLLLSVAGRSVVTAGLRHLSAQPVTARAFCHCRYSSVSNRASRPTFRQMLTNAHTQMSARVHTAGWSVAVLDQRLDHDARQHFGDAYHSAALISPTRVAGGM